MTLRGQIEALKKSMAESEQKLRDADEQRLQKLHNDIDVLSQKNRDQLSEIVILQEQLKNEKENKSAPHGVAEILTQAGGLMLKRWRSCRRRSCRLRSCRASCRMRKSRSLVRPSPDN